MRWVLEFQKIADIAQGTVTIGECSRGLWSYLTVHRDIGGECAKVALTRPTFLAATTPVLTTFFRVDYRSGGGLAG